MFRVRFAVLCAGTALCGPAFAEPVSGAAAADVSQPEIVVTANKRPERLIDVPSSITSIDGDHLEHIGARGLDDFLKEAPGASITELQPDLFRLTIRGIQSDDGSITAQDAGVFIDDAPFNDPFTTQVCPDLVPFDLAGVEVLKGPQGTLFGGSGLAGALRYRLRDAEPGVLAFKGFAQYADVDHGSPDHLAGAAMNLPVGDQAGVRFVVTRRVAGGVIDDLQGGDEDTDQGATSSSRALVRWNPTPQLSVGVKAVFQERSGHDIPLTENLDGHFTRRRALQDSPYDTAFQLYGLDLTLHLGFADLVSVTNQLRKTSELARAGERSLGTPFKVDIPVASVSDGVTQEFRLVSADDPQSPWHWLVGAFGYHWSGTFDQRVFFEPPAGDGQTAQVRFLSDVKADELALFGEVSRRLGGRWTATAGARAYHIKTDGTAVSSGPLIATPDQPENRNDADQSATGVNPKFALQFLATPQANLYASASRGFRFGGIQLSGATPDNPSVPKRYSPDSLWSYETGFKSRWLEHDALAVDGALFYIDWNNPQVRATTGGDFRVNVIDNVGSARSYGSELAIRYQPRAAGPFANLAASWQNAKITSDYQAPNGSTVRSGARLPGSYEVQVTTSLGYRGRLAGGESEALLTHSYQGRGYNDIVHSTKIGDYHVFDAQFSLEEPQLPSSPALTMGVLNIADKQAVVSAFFDSPDNFTATYNPPRTVFARVDLHF